MRARAVAFAIFMTSPMVASAMPISRTPSDQDTLTAVAAAAGRPKECVFSKSGRRPTVWQRARSPERLSYCGLVARATFEVEQDPTAALATLDLAEKAWPGHAGARALKGRALVAIGGKATEALAELDGARAIDADSVRDPKTLRDYARALAAVGRIADSANAYRALVPTASLLPSRDRSRVLLEAAFASMSDAAGKGDSPAGRYAEASSFLAEARSNDSDPLRADALLASALLAERAGDVSGANAFRDDAKRAGNAPYDPLVPYVADRADADAMIGLGLETTDPAASREAWQRFITASKTPAFVELAKAHLAKLPKGAGGKPVQGEPKPGKKPKPEK